MGTVMGRRQKDPKPTQPAASPEKRNRPSRNPLRRGPSSRDMQIIPSPEDSTIHLPSPPLRREPAMPRPTTAPPVERPQPPPEPQRANERSNGDTILPPPLTPSALPQTNGVRASGDAIPRQPEQPLPPPPIPAEVSTVRINCPFLHYSLVCSETMMVLAYQQLLPMRYPAPSKKPQQCKQVLFSLCGIEAPTDIYSDAESPAIKLDIRDEPIQEEDGDAQSALSSVASRLRAVCSPSGLYREVILTLS